MKKNIFSEFAKWSDIGLTMGLVIMACVGLYVAFFVKNKYVKAAFLAWEILP